MLSRFDIAIDTLRVYARPRDAALIAADLRDGGWSVGNNDDWVFIRELVVAAPRRDLRSGASREVRAALQRCVDGTVAAAGAANAVRFATLPDLLACLLRDLVQGRPPAWFWRKWQHLFSLPRGEAVTQLLWEHLAQGNAVFARLWTLHAMPALWQTLAPAHARLLLARAATLLALPASHFLELSVIKETEPDAGHGELANAFMRQRHDIVRWRTLLNGNVQHPDKLRLAATLAGLALMPQAVTQRPQQVMRAFMQCVSPDTVAQGQKVVEVSGIAARDLQVPTVQRTGTQIPWLADPGKAQANDLKRVDIATPRTAGPADFFSAVPDLKEGTGIASADTVNTSARGGLRQKGSKDLSASSPTDMAQPALYLTGHGGVFHLIKALDHPESYAVLRGNAEWLSLQNGWTLIYQLALALGAEPDGPLQRFFVQVGGFGNIAQLEAVRHPALVALLVPLLRKRYAAHLRWDASTMALPARIQASQSNVDVVFDMSAIRLPVRLCGLDVDPGWIPWLGRIVRFHYRDEIGLRVQQEHGGE